MSAHRPMLRSSHVRPILSRADMRTRPELDDSSSCPISTPEPGYWLGSCHRLRKLAVQAALIEVERTLAEIVRLT